MLDLSEDKCRKLEAKLETIYMYGPYYKQVRQGTVTIGDVTIVQ